MVARKKISTRGSARDLTFLLDTDAGPRVVRCPDEATLRALERMAAQARIAAEGATFYAEPGPPAEDGKLSREALRVTVWSAEAGAEARLREMLDDAVRFRRMRLRYIDRHEPLSVWLVEGQADAYEKYMEAHNGDQDTARFFLSMSRVCVFTREGSYNVERVFHAHAKDAEWLVEQVKADGVRVDLLLPQPRGKV